MIVFSLFHSRQEKNKLNLFFSYIYIQKMFPSGEQKSYLRICSIEIKRSENNLIIYQYNTYIRTYAESVNRFLCSIYKIESSNKCVCVTQTGGVLDNTAACSLWTAIRWPSRCITERRRKTDIKRIREEGEREAAATHQNWPTCIFSFSLSLAYADLQLAFTLQHRALVLILRTNNTTAARMICSLSLRVPYRCYSYIGQ